MFAVAAKLHGEQLVSFEDSNTSIQMLTLWLSTKSLGVCSLGSETLAC